MPFGKCLRFTFCSSCSRFCPVTSTLPFFCLLQHLKKILGESDGSLDIAVSLLVETPSAKENSAVCSTEDSRNQGSKESKNERSGWQKSKKGRSRTHRISSSEEDEHEASDGQESGRFLCRGQNTYSVFVGMKYWFALSSLAFQSQVLFFFSSCFFSISLYYAK